MGGLTLEGREALQIGLVLHNVVFMFIMGQGSNPGQPRADDIEYLEKPKANSGGHCDIGFLQNVTFVWILCGLCLET